MRTIEFKAKRVDNGEWVYGYYFFAFRAQQFALKNASKIYKEIVVEKPKRKYTKKEK